MHLGTAALIKFYQQHRDDESLVLVTIIGTAGSTYRKTGAMMLISQDHQYVGMISGGCLEGDLLQHADEVFASGQACKLTYDMHAGDDLVWSLGIGCDGIIHLLLQKLDRDSARSIFDWLSRSQKARQSVLLALSLGEEPPQVLGQLGAANSKGEQFGDSGLATLASQKAAIDWPQWRYQEVTEPNILLINIPPQPRVLICGAGPDAVPVAQQFIHLGWECVVADHRAAYACTGRFTEACETIVTRPEKLHLVVALEQLDAAIIMSHHLENDAAYLRQLAPMLRDNPDQDSPGKLAYLGVLGPGSRRDKLREMAACPQAGIRGPVGLDIGAELPEGIALSIAAEVHAALNCRNGLSLTLKTISPE